ncbi:MAG TPA: DUF2946 family protein [Aquabacterium sp.]|nr:DUF2946 family protein [Aquabacterium sp.]
MQAFRLTRRIHLVFIALAMWVATLSAAGWQPKANQAPDFLSEVCSVVHRADLPQPDSHGDLGHCFKHCLQASLHVLGLPPTEGDRSLPLLAALGDAVWTPRTWMSGQLIWQPLQARAPPVSLME